jgi:putative DNA primase/helicase
VRTSTATTENLLAPHHETMLTIGSYISPEVVVARGYFTVDEPEDLRNMGFAEYQSRVPAMAIPIFDVFGEFKFHRIRPDDPRPDRNKPNKVIKYEQPPDTPLVIDVSPAAFEGLRDTSRRLWIVEGEKKADALVSQSECAVALLGVWAWKRYGYPIPDWDQIPMIGREVRILFDSDAADKVEVRHALYSLSRFVRGRVHGS